MPLVGSHLSPGHSKWRPFYELPTRTATSLFPVSLPSNRPPALRLLIACGWCACLRPRPVHQCPCQLSPRLLIWWPLAPRQRHSTQFNMPSWYCVAHHTAECAVVSFIVLGFHVARAPGVGSAAANDLGGPGPGPVHGDGTLLAHSPSSRTKPCTRRPCAPIRISGVACATATGCGFPGW